jgi:hypothetical protein
MSAATVGMMSASMMSRADGGMLAAPRRASRSETNADSVGFGMTVVFFMTRPI